MVPPQEKLQELMKIFSRSLFSLKEGTLGSVLSVWTSEYLSLVILKTTEAFVHVCFLGCIRWNDVPCWRSLTMKSSEHLLPFIQFSCHANSFSDTPHAFTQIALAKALIQILWSSPALPHKSWWEHYIMTFSRCFISGFLDLLEERNTYRTCSPGISCSWVISYKEIKYL